MCRQIMQIIGIVKPSLSRHIKNPWTQYTLCFGSENKSTFRKVRIVMQLDIAVSRLEYNKRDSHDKNKVKTHLKMTWFYIQKFMSVRDANTSTLIQYRNC